MQGLGFSVAECGDFFQEEGVLVVDGLRLTACVRVVRQVRISPLESRRKGFTAILDSLCVALRALSHLLSMTRLVV